MMFGRLALVSLILATGCSKESPDDKSQTQSTAANNGEHRLNSSTDMPASSETERPQAVVQSVDAASRPQELWLALADDAKNIRSPSDTSTFNLSGTAVTALDLNKVPGERVAFFDVLRRRIRIAYIPLYIFQATKRDVKDQLSLADLKNVTPPAWASHLYSDEIPFISQGLKAAVAANGGSVSFTQLLNYYQAGASSLTNRETKASWTQQVTRWESESQLQGDSDSDGTLSVEERRAWEAKLKLEADALSKLL